MYTVRHPLSIPPCDSTPAKSFLTQASDDNPYKYEQRCFEQWAEAKDLGVVRWGTEVSHPEWECDG